MSYHPTFRVFLLLMVLLTASVSEAAERSTSIFCFRKFLGTIIENPHRAAKLVRPMKAHILKFGKAYVNTSREEQIHYLIQNVQGLEYEQARDILHHVFDHPRGAKNARVVFGGSRVRGNAHPDSDLDIGVFNFGNNRLTKLIKRMNANVSYGNYKIRLEETKIYEGNQTRGIPEIQSPEEFFMRKGKALLPDGSIRKFRSSGFISIGEDGTIIHVPPQKMNSNGSDLLN